MLSDVSHVDGRGPASEESLIDVGTPWGFSVVAEIDVNHGPVGGIAVSPDGGRLLVTNHGGNSVSVIDTGTGAVRTVVGTDEPFAVAVNGAQPSRAYISTVSAAYDAIVVIDVNTIRVVEALPVALSVSDLAVSPDGKHVYASRTAAYGADVAILDTTTGRVDAIDITAAPGTTTHCLRVSPDGHRLYVAAQGPSDGELVVIDTRGQRIVETIKIGAPIRDVAVSPDGTTGYVASCGPDFGAVLDVVDTRTNMVTHTCKIGEIDGLLMQLTLSGDGERAYLVTDDSVAVLSTHAHDVLGTIAAGTQPSCVVESPDGRYLYVADYSGAVTVVSIASPPAAPVSGDEIIAEADRPGEPVPV